MHLELQGNYIKSSSYLIEHYKIKVMGVTEVHGLTFKLMHTVMQMCLLWRGKEPICCLVYLHSTPIDDQLI